MWQTTRKHFQRKKGGMMKFSKAIPKKKALASCGCNNLSRKNKRFDNQLSILPSPTSNDK
eukprot:scaffold707_cov138-Skeletonema_menzelii.AAC.8